MQVQRNQEFNEELVKKMNDELEEVMSIADHEVPGSIDIKIFLNDERLNFVSSVSLDGKRSSLEGELVLVGGQEPLLLNKMKRNQVNKLKVLNGRDVKLWECKMMEIAMYFDASIDSMLPSEFYTFKAVLVEDEGKVEPTEKQPKLYVV